MADAKCCDRCKNFYNKEDRPIVDILDKSVIGLGIRYIDNGPVINSKAGCLLKIDLCPKCLSDFKIWFDNLYSEKEGIK